MSNRKNGQKNTRKKPSFIMYLVPVFLVAVLVVSGGLFLRDFMEYRKADQEYEQLDQLIEVSGTEEGRPTAAAKEEEKEPETEPQGPPVWADAAWHPDLKADTAGLSAVNPEFVAVIWIPGLDIRYPVAAGADNTRYLTTTFEGNTNSSGCIFMDCGASRDLSDLNTFIFGHNMRNGSMFGRLKTYTDKKELCASDPNVYLYHDGKLSRYEIFSYYLSDLNCSAYAYAGAEAVPENYDAFVSDARNRSESGGLPAGEYSLIDFTKKPCLLTLSTCSGNQHVGRMLVHCALVAEYPDDSGQEQDISGQSN